MDEHSEGEDSPSAPKYRKKLQGSATYKSKFNPAWTKEFAFIGPVANDVAIQVSTAIRSSSYSVVNAY